jgi:hypothetical protein
MSYEGCESLTVIDLPGFRQDPGISENILAAVRKVLVKKPKAVLIAVDESQQQFANNVAVNKVRIDLKDQCSNFNERTIIVLNKFDETINNWEGNNVNTRFALERMEDGIDDKDFGSAPRFWTSNPDYDAQPELNKLLSDAGEFTAWHRQRCAKDREVAQRRTNNHKFAKENVGVDKLKHYLKCFLFEKYQEQVPEVIAAIDKKMKDLNNELIIMNNQMREDCVGPDPEDMRRLFSRLCNSFVTVLQELLRSPALLGEAYTKKYGQTLDEELTQFREQGLEVRDMLLEPEQLVEELNPPSDERNEQIKAAKTQFLSAFDGYEDLRREFVIKVPSEMKAYAGWQYTRILEDIQLAVRFVEPAKTTLMQGVEIGSAHVSADLLINQMIGIGSKNFIPIFDAICVRFYMILERLFSIVYEVASTTQLVSGADPSLRQFATLSSVSAIVKDWYMTKLVATLKEARKRMMYYLESCVEVLGTTNAVMFEPDLPTIPCNAKDRVRKEMANVVHPPDLPVASDRKEKYDYQLQLRHRWCFAQVRHHLSQSLEPNLAMLVKNVLFFDLRKSAATYPYDIDLDSLMMKNDVAALVGTRKRRQAAKKALEKQKAVLSEMTDLAKQLKNV